MNNSNIKVYLAISFALIVLFILVLVVPFTKKSSPLTPNGLIPSPYSPFPTSVQTGSSLNVNRQPLITVPVAFTGALEEPIPQQVIDLAAQKKDLRSKVLLDLSTFTIDFNYSEDKFIVSLRNPKDQAQKEFESWRTINYPALSTDQFLIK